MPIAKWFKIHIDRVAAVNVQGLDFSMIRVEIRNKSGQIIKTSPLNQLSHTIITAQAESHAYVKFSLLQFSSMGSRQFRVFAQGIINFSVSEIAKDQTLALGCPIKNIVNKKTIVSLALLIKQDLQKMTYTIPDSQSEDASEQQILKESSVMAMQTITTPVPSPRILQPPVIKKPSPVKALKRPVRNRHSQYLLKSQTPKMQLTNKIINQTNVSVENLRFQLDEPVSSVQFYANASNQMLAQVVFSSNPTQEEMKFLKIKVPENEKIIDIHLKTLEGQKLYASTNLPNLESNQSLKIACQFKDQKNKVKGKLKFNYKQSAKEEETDSSQKMQMAQQVSMFDRKKLNQQLESMRFLFPQPKSKQQQSPRTKLPKIFHKQSNFSFQTINQKIAPSITIFSQSQKNESQPNSERNKKSSLFQQSSYISKLNQPSRPTSKIKRSKTIHSRTRIRPETPVSPRKGLKNVINISGISVKFYKSYLEHNRRQPRQQAFSGKFLQIYSNQKNIYRSEIAFASTTLNWKLKNCLLEINDCENLTFQLNLQKQKTQIGELVISYNQLRFNQQQNSLYFGYLTNEYEVVAKICIEFMLQQNSLPSYREENKSKVQDKTQRRTRMKRLYSQDFAYYVNDDISRSPNKQQSLYSSAVLQPANEDTRIRSKTKNYQNLSPQLQMIQQRKRKQKSPTRR